MSKIYLLIKWRNTETIIYCKGTSHIWSQSTVPILGFIYPCSVKLTRENIKIYFRFLSYPIIEVARAVDFLSWKRAIDGLLQDCNVLELLQSCTKTSIWNRPVSLWYGRPQVACGEPVGSYDKTTRTAICFEHKTQYLLIRAPYTRIVVFWHISNIPPPPPHDFTESN